MKKSQNRLDPKNCNKAMCKSCIFGPTPIKLTQARMNEITTYLAEGSSSHVCHTTNLTCYGALQFTAQIFHARKIIPKPTVESLLETAAIYLKKG